MKEEPSNPWEWAVREYLDTVKTRLKTQSTTKATTIDQLNKPGRVFMEGEEGQEAPRRNQKEESEKMTVKTKTKSKGTNAKTATYYEAKIELLEAENEILRNAVEELKSELEEKKDDLEGAEEDNNTAWEEYSKLEKAYITARTLVNIPGDIEGLVFELIKTRFLLWGELVTGNKAPYEIEPEQSDLITILPPAERLRTDANRRKPGSKDSEQARR